MSPDVGAGQGTRKTREQSEQGDAWKHTAEGYITLFITRMMLASLVDESECRDGDGHSQCASARPRRTACVSFSA